MNAGDKSLDECTRAVKLLRKNLSVLYAVQVRTQDERALMSATAYAWFRAQRLNVELYLSETDLAAVDGCFRGLLELADKTPSRSKCDLLLKKALSELTVLKGKIVIQPTASLAPAPHVDVPPDFSKLATDPEMQRILIGRWDECGKCISIGAALAAIVMMGGLLESLLLARIHRETDKAPIFATSSSPKDRSGKCKTLNEWGLRDYLAVAQELKWISKPVHDLSDVLRDYRNFVHPHKQLQMRQHFAHDDVVILWDVAKGIARQLSK